jgi:cytochrome c nitrite reductase small subunit
MRKEPGTEADVRPGSGSRSVPVLPLLLSVAVGVLAGIGSYTFSYAKGFSYFSTDPRACVNCHIMQSQYDGWQKASHHQSAVCIDCHLPHDFIPKYLAKSENGWRHGKLFTTGGFVEPIVVKPAGREILEQNCVRCHSELTAEIRGAERVGAHDTPGLRCTHCHADAGHGSRAGLGGPLSAAELASLSKHQPQTSSKSP